MLDTIVLEFLPNVIHSLFSFFVIISIIIFIHEFGHYAFAKYFGVKVETFSVGFGKELIGFSDRSGTRWKICAIPMGGYVKMFGDADAAGTSDEALYNSMTAEEKQFSFLHKSLYQRALIVLGGPVANFILSLVVLSGLFFSYGKPIADPIIGLVADSSPAAVAGLHSGDRISKINDQNISSFADIQRIVMLNVKDNIHISYIRDDKEFLTSINVKTDSGTTRIIGISSSSSRYMQLSMMESIQESFLTTYSIITQTMSALSQILTGQRPASELGGPIKIAQYSGKICCIRVCKYFVVYSITINQSRIL